MALFWALTENPRALLGNVQTSNEPINSNARDIAWDFEVEFFIFVTIEQVNSLLTCKERKILKLEYRSEY